jgi:hypothetical protein
MPKKPTGGKPVTKNILLADITTDPEVQARVGLSEEVIADYGSAMLEGAKFPPAVVFDDGTELWLSDGFHRYTAAGRIGIKDPYLYCEIREGTKRDAMLYAFQANLFHGLRPSTADKRKAVATMLDDPEWKGWADREIARWCGVSHPFVGKMRAELAEVSGGATTDEDDDERRYIDKHGTETTMRRKHRGVPRRQVRASDKKSDQQEAADEDSSFVAGSDRAAIEVTALRSANEKLSQDKRALQTKVEAQEGEIADLKDTLGTFQGTDDKWRDTVDTQRDIIATLQTENANLKAGIAQAPMPGEPKPLLELLRETYNAVCVTTDYPPGLSKAATKDATRHVVAIRDHLHGLREAFQRKPGRPKKPTDNTEGDES